jgi:formylglycine-generating enzyme required for sulfatase activity
VTEPGPATGLSELPGLRPPRAASGRADLVRLVASLPAAHFLGAAAALGFEAAPARTEPTPPIGASLHDSPDTTPPDDALPSPPAPTARTPFWRMEEMTFADPPEQQDTARAEVRPAEPEPSPATPLQPEDIEDPGGRPLATPRPRPLAPWSRLWPSVRDALGGVAPGRDPDVSALVRAWSRGEDVRRIPRVPRKVWAARVSLWVDRSLRLVPFWSDQEDVCARIRRACGQSALTVRVLDARAQADAIAHRGDFLAGLRPDPGTPVLLLGDLATYASASRTARAAAANGRSPRDPAARLCAAWQRTARLLQRVGVPLAALVPAPRQRWFPPVARLWNATPWEAGRRGVPTPQLESHDAQAERLLRLASLAAFLQPGLLRELRLLLPAATADAATEADVWSHPDVRAADATGLVLHPDAAIRLRSELADQLARAGHEDLLDCVRRAIARWHAALPKELLYAETLAWITLIPAPIAAPPADRDQALQFAARLEASSRKAMGDPGPRAAVVRRYAASLLLSLPDVTYASVPGLARTWAATFRGAPSVRVPATFDPAPLYAELERAGPPRWWAVRQIGGDLVLSPSVSHRVALRGRITGFGIPGEAIERSLAALVDPDPSAPWPSHPEGPGSPVAWLLAASPRLWLKRPDEASERQIALEDGLCVPAPDGGELRLRSDRCTVTLRPWAREPWAAAAGRDRYGLWAEADVKGVAVRFRWIPPGRFWMGSPENEAGRREWEGPRHRVTWTRGRWLCDVPVTQALWEAVMGDNPSRFRSPDRPVELVSWEDCEAFLKQLDTLVPGLRARLPTEAEWEHACRAGTETATWAGDLEILGKNDAPLLDDLAWYGGNCGVDFDLSDGDKTTGEGWEEKQYAFSRGGTRPVRSKRANPLGLFDMLGNVYERCMDARPHDQPYAGRDVVNPPPAFGSSSQSVRGGAWFAPARNVRAAFCYAHDPAVAAVYIGFRLARSQHPSTPSAPEPEPAKQP